MPKAVDSLDLVEAVMLIEEVLETEIPDGDAKNFGSPQEVVDWLELHLSNQRPNKQAAALLTKLAKAHENPRLAEGLGRHMATRTNCRYRPRNLPTIGYPRRSGCKCFSLFVRKT